MRLSWIILFIAVATALRCDFDNDCCGGLMGTAMRGLCVNGTCSYITGISCANNAACQNQLSDIVMDPWDVSADFLVDTQCVSGKCSYAAKRPPMIAGNPGQCPACYRFVPRQSGWGECDMIHDCCHVDNDCDPCYSCDQAIGACKKKFECCMLDDDCIVGPGACGDMKCRKGTLSVEGHCEYLGTQQCNVGGGGGGGMCDDGNGATFDMCESDGCRCCHTPVHIMDECASDLDCMGWTHDTGRKCRSVSGGIMRCVDVGEDEEGVNHPWCDWDGDCKSGMHCFGGGRCGYDERRTSECEGRDVVCGNHGDCCEMCHCGECCSPEAPCHEHDVIPQCSVIRDFRPPSDGMEMASQYMVVDTGFVLTHLGSDKLPQFNPAANPLSFVGGEDTFWCWYHDCPDSMKLYATDIIVFIRDTGGDPYLWYVDSRPRTSNAAFFPIDNLALGNDGIDSYGRSRNYHFTIATCFKFVHVSGGGDVSISTDDDMWLFLDGHLVLDMGGVVPVRTRSISVGTGLSVGTTHELCIFSQERHTVDSVMEFSIREDLLPACADFGGACFEHTCDICSRDSDCPEPATMCCSGHCVLGECCDNSDCEGTITDHCIAYTCDSRTHSCISGPAVDCDDHVTCTIDSCVDGICSNEADDSECDIHTAPHPPPPSAFGECGRYGCNPTSGCGVVLDDSMCPNDPAKCLKGKCCGGDSGDAPVCTFVRDEDCGSQSSFSSSSSHIDLCHDVVCYDRNECTVDWCNPDTGICEFPQGGCIGGYACCSNRCVPDNGPTDESCHVDDPCIRSFCDPDCGCIREVLPGCKCTDDSWCNQTNECETWHCDLPSGECFLEYRVNCTEEIIMDACLKPHIQRNGDGEDEHHHHHHHHSSSCDMQDCPSEYIDVCLGGHVDILLEAECNVTSGECPFIPTCWDDDCCTEDSCISVWDDEGEFVRFDCHHDHMDCDDGIAWTVDLCNRTTCSCDHITCHECGCDWCNDHDPCTIDTCEGSECIYTPIICNDHNKCTSDICIEGHCIYPDSVVCQDDDDPCTTTECDPETGRCTVTGHTVCPSDGDHDACTYLECDSHGSGECVPRRVECGPASEGLCATDKCVNGVCIHYNESICMHDPEIIEALRSSKCLYAECLEDSGCVVRRKVCDSGSPCLVGHCNDDTGRCAYSPVDCYCPNHIGSSSSSSSSSSISSGEGDESSSDSKHCGNHGNCHHSSNNDESEASSSHGHHGPDSSEHGNNGIGNGSDDPNNGHGNGASNEANGNDNNGNGNDKSSNSHGNNGNNDKSSESHGNNGIGNGSDDPNNGHGNGASNEGNGNENNGNNDKSSESHGNNGIGNGSDDPNNGHGNGESNEGNGNENNGNRNNSNESHGNNGIGNGSDDPNNGDGQGASNEANGNENNGNTAKNNVEERCCDIDLCVICGCSADRGGCYVDHVACDTSNPCAPEHCEPCTGECVAENLDCGCTPDGRLRSDRCKLCWCSPDEGGCATELIDCDDDDETTDDWCHEGECHYRHHECNETSADLCMETILNQTTGECEEIPKTCPPIMLPDGTQDLCMVVLGCNSDTGVCEYRHKPCLGGDMCHPVDCNSHTGRCETIGELDCNDDNPCTYDWCQSPMGACHNDQIDCGPSRYGLCGTKTCIREAGGCIDTLKDCNDHNSCTSDACDEQVGECVYTESDHGECVNRSTNCMNCHCDPRDWVARSLGRCRTLRNGRCDDEHPPCVCEPVDCSVSDPCLVGYCDMETGDCRASPKCPVGPIDACTAITCNHETGQCEIESILNCEDENPCTNDCCDPILGCTRTRVSCDDDNMCTIDFCRASLGGCVNQEMDCDDHNPMTIDECENGTCKHRRKIPCDDEDPCTDDWFDQTLGKCQNEAINCTPEGEIDPCITWSCEACTGLCVSAPVTCEGYGSEEDDACTYYRCDSRRGGCVTIDFPCHDDDPCTIDECDPITGDCSNIPIDCNDNDTCTEDSCDAHGECVNMPKYCADGDACTVDLCVEGVCTHSTPRDCSNMEITECDICTCHPITGTCICLQKDCRDSNMCTDDVCEPDTGHCSHPRFVCPHVPCEIGECIEADGSCVYMNVTCPHGKHCDPDMDECVYDNEESSSSPPPHSSESSHVHPSSSSHHHDESSSVPIIECPPHGADLCSIYEINQNNECVQIGRVVCNDGDLCTKDWCDPSNGLCVYHHYHCDDSNMCTVDECDGNGGCSYTAKDCDDHDACTRDRCSTRTGNCVYELTYWGYSGRYDDTIARDVKASKHERCDSWEVVDKCKIVMCNPLDGSLSFDDINCDDTNPCTDDSCDEFTGECVHTGTHACNDNDPCTYDDCAVRGDGTLSCFYTEKTCNDGNAHTIDWCNSNTGKCEHIHTECDNCHPCFVNRSVGRDGRCESQPIICDDNNKCTDDSCDYTTGRCIYDDNSARCNDNNACTVDICSAETGLCSHETLHCSHSDQCMMAHCDTRRGCEYEPMDCGNSSDPCTTRQCVSGECTDTPKRCNDGDECTHDSCNHETGECEFTPYSSPEECGLWHCNRATGSWTRNEGWEGGDDCTRGARGNDNNNNNVAEEVPKEKEHQHHSSDHHRTNWGVFWIIIAIVVGVSSIGGAIFMILIYRHDTIEIEGESEVHYHQHTQPYQQQQHQQHHNHHGRRMTTTDSYGRYGGLYS